MANVERIPSQYSDDYYWTINNIQQTENPHGFKNIIVEPGMHSETKGESVWIVVDGKGANNTSYAWVNVDDAEAIGLAILDAVAQTRKAGEK